MDESAAALRPLDEASGAVDRLSDYESTQDLASALLTVREAVERALRRRLRADASAPDAERLTAMSPGDLPLAELVRSLRSRDLISLDTAGAIHELDAAAGRATSDAARAADADAAIRAVDGVRRDFARTGAGSSAAPAATATPPDSGSLGVAAAGADPPRGRRPAKLAAEKAGAPPERRGRGMALFAAGLAFLVLVVMALVFVRGGTADYDSAVAMFRAGRLDSAAVAFQQVLEDRPTNVDAMLYMGRIHRRQGRPAQAAEVLREAAGIAPGDPDIRREIGHLFMELGQPRAAVAQYERALESDPDESRTWAALIRALRTAGDPRAERMLSEAPADVQAMLGQSGS